MMCKRHYLCSIVLATLAACSGARSQWHDLDYSSVYRQYQGRENDPYYVPPTGGTGCIDDDLFNCK